MVHQHTVRRLRRLVAKAAIVVSASVLLCASLASSASAALTVTPITWDVVGLDHNRPLTSGPELFPVGAEVCSDVATTNVQVDLDWTDGNGNGWDFGAGHPYINARNGSLTSLTFPSIAAGDCVDAYFELRITRSAAAFGQTREYEIIATDLSGSASSPTPRQIYVEQLVSQNRNTTTLVRYGQLPDQSDWQAATNSNLNLAINETYFIELTTETSTAFEEIQSFLTLSNTIFQVVGVSTTYDDLTAPPSRVPVPNPQLWADGCLWESDPTSLSYHSCLSVGKAGGEVVTTYEIRIISGGGDAVTLYAMIYDRSGSSFHYNADYSPVGGGQTYDPSNAGFAKRFVPDTIGLGGTSRLRFTITNPNPVDIFGYNFIDTLPAGVDIASPANATTTCGGTVTAVPGTDEIALAGGFASANGSCSVLVDVTAAAAGTYNNVSQNLFIGDIDTGNNATATLTVSSTPPPVLVCDDLATLALWEFPLAASATAPAPTSNVVAASAAAGAGLSPVISSQNNDTGGSWASDNINTGVLNTANLEYFEFTIDTTGLDEITLDFASRRTANGTQNLQLYYGTSAQNASTVYSNVSGWTNQTATTLTSGLNPTGNTVFRLYAYNSTLNNNGHSVFIDGVRFRGLYCSEIVPPPPVPGVLAPTISKAFSPTPIGIGHESTLTFTITNPNPVTALSGIAFTDELPSGVSVVSGTFGGTCTGFWGNPPGFPGVLNHAGGSLVAAASCTLTVDVTSTTAGTAVNLSEPIYATQSGYNTNVTTGIAQASLVRLASPIIDKGFVPSLVLRGVTPNDASTLTFQIRNPNPANSIGGVSFTDNLALIGLEVANPANAATVDCGAPTWAPLPGNTLLSFSGGSIAASDVCTVTVDVTGPNGVYDNVSSAVSHIVSGVSATNGDTAEAQLVIDDPIPSVALRKEVGAGSDPDTDPWSSYLATTAGSDVFYKITVENTGELPLTGLVVSDPDVDTTGCIWPDPLPVADILDSHIVTCVVGPVTAVVGTQVNTAIAEATSTHGDVDATDSATYEASPECTVDADCTDALFCNGTETCVANVCTAGTDPCTGGADCADTCNEAADNCFDTAGTACGSSSDTVCDNPDTCNGSGACQVNNEPNTTTCRADAGQCDVAETCDGAGNCPADAFEPNTTSCTGASQAGVCDNDASDRCLGTANTCVDAYQPITTTCRADAGQCDVAEVCTGSSGSCPADAFEPITTSCTGSSQAGVCDNDASDRCLGTANTCVDAYQPITTTCRADAGQCDVAEVCTGSSGACPADAFEPITTACTGASNGGVCDGTDLCSGSANTCVEVYLPITTTCRADAGQCDVAEVCTGSSGACPADAFEPNTTSCTGASQAGVCDNDAADRCTGTANTCVDAYLPITTTCRADAGQCDVAEVCTGSSGACPADAFEPNTTSCTGASQAGVCDNDAADRCTGTANTCVDAYQPITTTCRADAGQCDVAEVCTGSSGACPADAFELSGTACGSSGNTTCDNPDTCNGSGTCQINNEADGTSCDDLLYCNGTDTCSTGSCVSSGDPCFGAGCDEINDICPAPTDLSLTKTDLPDPVLAGGTLTYTLSYSNVGSTTLTNAVVVENYDVRTTFVSATPPPDLGDDTWVIGDLEPGETGAITITMTVSGALADGTVLSNQAILSADGTPPAAVTEPTTVRRSLANQAALRISKSVSPTVAPSGALLTYTVTASNTGPATSYDTIVSDTLPAGLTYMNAVPAPSLVLGDYIEWEAGDLPAGASVTYVVYAESSDALAAGTLIENCAEAAGSPGSGTVAGAGLSAQGCATSSVTGPGQDCRLVMTKRGVGIAMPGGEIVYRCLWCDPCVDAPSVFVIDDLPPEVEFVSVSSRDMRGFQLLETSGRQQLVLDIGVLPKGRAGIAHIRTRVKDNVAPGTIVSNEIRIEDAAGRVQSDTDLTTIGTGVASDLSGQPSLKVTGNTRAKAGGSVQYMARYSNLAPGSTALITLTDTITPTYVSPAPSTRSTRSLVWTGLEGSGIIKVKGKTVMTDPAARGGVVSVEAMVSGPDGIEVVKAGVDTALLASTSGGDSGGGGGGGGSSGGGGGDDAPAGSSGKASLTAPSFVRAGLSSTLMLRYSKLIGASKATMTVPEGVTVESTFPAATSIVGNVIKWDGLAATSGMLKATIIVPENVAPGASLTVGAAVTDDAGTVGLERTMGVR